MYCHHRHLRGLAGSRARVFRARKTRIPRAQSLFFLYLFHGKCLAQLDYPSTYFLCNHKHIQSFVNSVLIIAKTLSLSLLLSARAFIIEASYRERERERKKEKKRYTILIFFLLVRKKKGVHEKKKEGKRRKETRENPDTKRRHKIIIFARPLSLSLSIF